jgi:hypothetical protein
MGRAIPRNMAPQHNGPPSYKDCVKINSNNINLVAGITGVDPGQLLRRTIAHELCHSVNVWHHGDGPGEPHLAFRPNTGNQRMAETAGLKSSGDVNCVMREFTPDGWCHDHNGQPHNIHRVTTFNGQPVGINGQPVGTLLCQAANGTNGGGMIVNDFGPGHRNDATWNRYPAGLARGAGCRGQIWVRDPR